jgi:hypothetical protein
MAEKDAAAIQDVLPTHISDSKEETEVAVAQPLPDIPQSNEVVATSASERVEAPIQSTEEIDYPHGVKLVSISACVALSVFLVALVSSH